MNSAVLDSPSYLLVRVAKAHRARVAEGLAELELHVGQELVLAQLWREDRLRHSQLAERLGIERPTVTKVVSGLERAGLVVREPDEEDGRAARVHLTERGRSIRRPVEQTWRASETAALRGLDGRERALVARALSRMLTNLE